MKHIAVVNPLERERRELGRIAKHCGAEVSFLGPDASYDFESLDIHQLIKDALAWCRENKPDGILSSGDYPGSIIAHIIARECGLPHVDPALILACQHKYNSRNLQQNVVPDATPRYFLIDPYAIDYSRLPYPFFVKPVKSCFSILSRNIPTAIELDAVIKQSYRHFDTQLRPFNKLLSAYSDFPLSANYLIGEELLEGHQVTVEGYMHEGAWTIIGVVDSIMFPGTHSFKRFEFPSVLSEQVCTRMAAIAEKLLKGIGYHNAMVNIEMMYNPASDDIKIIEINTRMSSQFADLFEKVHGINTYEMLINLCCGVKPRWQPYSGNYRAAASCVLRTFEDQTIREIPSPSDIERVYVLEPDIRIELFGSVGHTLSEERQDGMSYRYGLINIGAQSHTELMEKFKRYKHLLPFSFEPALHSAPAS
ncbi:ATP-grasp domain-containing protein [Candidatus Uhrbacteria bacterium]|nr:ATP-grasp domain-containing protein [Candidatus Uhrbacteria bacterium]